MPGLTDKVIEALRTTLGQGALRAGDRIPTEAALMQQFSVSRSVIREALSRLQAAGLVETRHGVGTFVRTPPPGEALNTMALPAPDMDSLHDVMALLEFRIDVETAAAGLAASRRTMSQLQAIAAALDGWEQEVRSGGRNVAVHDVAFHLHIANASGNRYFSDVLRQLGRDVIPRTRLGNAALAVLDERGHLITVLQEHRAIYLAIERQDIEVARAAMRLHLGNSRERMREAHRSASPGLDSMHDIENLHPAA